MVLERSTASLSNDNTNRDQVSQRSKCIICWSGCTARILALQDTWNTKQMPWNWKAKPCWWSKMLLVTVCTRTDTAGVEWSNKSWQKDGLVLRQRCIGNNLWFDVTDWDTIGSSVEEEQLKHHIFSHTRWDSLELWVIEWRELQGVRVNNCHSLECLW